MRGDDLKKLNEGFYDQVFLRRNIDAVDQFLTEDFVEHIPMPGQAPGRQGAKDLIQQVLRAFPDLEYEIEYEVAQGDAVATALRMTGTHRAEFAGVPATGKKVSVQVMDMARVREDRFCEHWGLIDVSSLMAQLGAAPTGR